MIADEDRERRCWSSFLPSAAVPQIKDYFALFDYDVKLLADALAAKKGSAK